MANTKKLASDLSKAGPHRVLRGNLALAGLPGIVYTPTEGLNLPAVAFAHGWLVGPGSYAKTLQHLASWGIVAAAPATERGLVPSHLALADDLRTALDICTGVRLGNGNISVGPDRLAVAGHSMGAGAAVIAASTRKDLAAVACLFPAPTAPKAETFAPSVTAPALVIGSPTELISMAADPFDLANSFGGSAILRTVDKSSRDGVLEGRRALGKLGVGGGEKKTQKTARALLTGFLLFHLTGDDTYADFAAEDADIKSTLLVDPSAPLPVVPRKKGGTLRQVSQFVRR